MYSTCIYCHKPLGSNSTIEHFPVGRRLAFDGAKGRLWVVCRSCERWNLSPLDTRWEAIEECEAQFRATRLRVSTDNIGLARLREGLELVRIGDPERPEFASWRYGDQFGRRRRRAMYLAGGAAVAMGAVIIGSSAAGIGLGGFGGIWANLPQLLNSMRSVKLKTDDGRVLKVPGTQFGAVTLVHDIGDGGPVLGFKAHSKLQLFRGAEALRLAGQLLPAINYSGGNKTAVADAVRAIEQHEGPDAYLESAIPRSAGSRGKGERPMVLSKMKAAQRLAIEMALHEESERRAIEGELAILESAWRAADEIAAIADNLFVSPVVETQLDSLKQRAANDRTS